MRKLRLSLRAGGPTTVTSGLTVLPASRVTISLGGDDGRRVRSSARPAAALWPVRLGLRPGGREPRGRQRGAGRRSARLVGSRPSFARRGCRMRNRTLCRGPSRTRVLRARARPQRTAHQPRLARPTSAAFICDDLLAWRPPAPVDAVLCRGVLNDVTVDAQRRAALAAFSSCLGQRKRDPSGPRGLRHAALHGDDHRPALSRLTLLGGSALKRGTAQPRAPKGRNVHAG